MKFLRWFQSKGSTHPRIEPRCRRAARSRTIVIHHYCPHTYNAGDHFVIRSIRKHMAAHLPHAVFIPKACARNRGWGEPIGLKGENIGRANRSADAVVIGGSDQYNNWSLRIRADEIAGLAPPLFLVGLGVSSRELGGEPRIDKKEYLRDIAATNEVARMSSVRDAATDEFLRRLGVTKQVVTGCPALYLFDEPFVSRPAGPVVFTFPFPVVRHDDRGKFEELLRLQREVLAALRSRGERCLISCHDDRDVAVADEAFPEEEIFFSNYVDQYFDLYRNAKMVVGSRLHAAILAAGMGVPFLNVNLDLRGKGFTKTFGLEDWNVDHGEGDLRERVLDRYRRVCEGRLEPFEEFYVRKKAMRSIFDDFVAQMCAEIASRT